MSGSSIFTNLSIWIFNLNFIFNLLTVDNVRFFRYLEWKYTAMNSVSIVESIQNKSRTRYCLLNHVLALKLSPPFSSILSYIREWEWEKILNNGNRVKVVQKFKKSTILYRMYLNSITIFDLSRKVRSIPISSNEHGSPCHQNVQWIANRSNSSFRGTSAEHGETFRTHEARVALNCRCCLQGFPLPSNHENKRSN